MSERKTEDVSEMIARGLKAISELRPMSEEARALMMSNLDEQEVSGGDPKWDRKNRSHPQKAIKILPHPTGAELRKEIKSKTEEADRDVFDARKRAAEKQASRDKDASDLANGVKTVEELNKENGAFRFPPGRVKVHLGKGKVPR